MTTATDILRQEHDAILRMLAATEQAEALLSQAEQQQLAQAFAEFDREKMGEGTHERQLALRDRVLAEIHFGRADKAKEEYPHAPPLPA